MDHTAVYVSMYNQVSLGASDTVRSKETYDNQPTGMGIRIHKYHGDNGVYKSKLFSDDLEKKHYTMSFSSVSAYGQNGVVERAIQTIVNSARTMILHKDLLWTNHFDTMLWSFTLDHAAYL